MEGLSTNVYKTLKTYCRRRGYLRLNDAVPRQDPNKPDPTPKPDPTRVRKRISWSLKIGKKIRILRRVGSPGKWVIRIRDAYVKMMLNFANSWSLGSVGYGGSVGNVYGFGPDPVKEYDEKVIVEIYKSLVMEEGHLVPHRQTIKLNSISR